MATSTVAGPDQWAASAYRRRRPAQDVTMRSPWTIAGMASHPLRGRRARHLSGIGLLRAADDPSQVAQPTVIPKAGPPVRGTLRKSSYAAVTSGTPTGAAPHTRG